MASMIMNRTWAATIKPKRQATYPITVICPIDFSERGSVALHCAMQIARQRRGKLLVVHVVPESREQDATIEPTCESALARLEHFAPASPGLNCEWVVLQGNVADQILELAAGCDTPQIVMATRGRSGHYRTLIGRTAEEVLRRAACPVVIVTNEDISATRRSEPVARPLRCAIA